MHPLKHLLAVLHARGKELCVGLKGLFKCETEMKRPVGIVEPLLYLVVVVARCGSAGAWFTEHSDQTTKWPKRKDLYILITSAVLVCVVFKGRSELWAWLVALYVPTESLFGALSMLFVSPYWTLPTSVPRSQTREPISPARSMWLMVLTYAQVVFAFAFLFVQPGIEVIRVSCGNIVGSPLESIYFSLVTITTLGYGDYLPSSALAQRLVIAEVGIGMFLIVVFIGRVLALIGRENDAND